MNEIGDTLTNEILFGKLSKGGEAKVDCQDEKLVFSYTKKALFHYHTTERPAGISSRLAALLMFGLVLQSWLSAASEHL